MNQISPSQTFESPKHKLDSRIRKPGMPTALKRTKNIPLMDSFLQAFYHIPEFVETIMLYDDVIVSEENIMIPLQRLIVQLVMNKRKDCSACDLYSSMAEDFNNRFKNLEEFLRRFYGKVDDALGKYNTMLSLSLDKYEETHPILDLFVGKQIQDNNESTFYMIRLQNISNLLEGWQNAFMLDEFDQAVYIKTPPKVLIFEISQCQNEFVIDQQIFIDRFLYSNREALQQHSNQINQLKQRKEEIYNRIRQFENYNQSNASIPDMLESAIQIIQSQRNELLDGDPAVEGLVNMIMNANKQLETMKGELKSVDDELKAILVNFHKNQYNLHAVIVNEGEYESAFIKQGNWFCFEDGFVEAKQNFQIDSVFNLNATMYLIYTSNTMTSKYTPIKDLLEGDTRSYEQLIRKELKQYAQSINAIFESETVQYKHQQMAEDVHSQYQIRYNYVSRIINKRNMYELPYLTNYATFLTVFGVDDIVKWQMLDCALRDVTGSTIHEIKTMSALAQKLSLLLYANPQRAPTSLQVQKKDQQILNVRLQEYVYYKQITEILVYAIQCLLEDRAQDGLNAIRAIQELNVDNKVSVLSIDVLKLTLLRKCFTLFMLHQTQQYGVLWLDMLMIMAFWAYLPDKDLIGKQVVRIIKDVLKKANKKAFNADQQKIIKKYLTAVEDKKPYDVGLNLLMRKDAMLDSLIAINWQNDYYHWQPVQCDDVSQQLIIQIQIFNTQYDHEMKYCRILLQQKSIFEYDDRIKMQCHYPI